MLKKPKSKSDQKAVNLKFYYEYHIWGLQKSKNYQNIPIGRGCMNFKNLAFILGWAQSLSDFFSISGLFLNQIEAGQSIFCVFSFEYV